MQVIRAKAGDWIGSNIRLATDAILVIGTEITDSREAIEEKCLQVIQAEREKARRHQAVRRRRRLDTVDGTGHDGRD